MKRCRVCALAEGGHQEELRLITAWLRSAIAPRAIARRTQLGGVTRLDITHHRDVCIADQIADEEQEEKAS